MTPPRTHSDPPQIGRSRLRVEDRRFLTGQGRFLADLTGGTLTGIVLRSPHAHARILRIDTAAAAALPGVRLILTCQDLRAEGIGDLPCPVQVATEAPLIVPPRPALADGVVRFVGDPVAFLVADTAAQAQDAAEAVLVEYETLPAITDATAALAGGAVQLWPQAPGNCAFTFRRGDAALVSAAFAAADRIVTLDLINNRIAAVPMEARAASGQYDAARGQFLLTLSGQGVHTIRAQMAAPILGVAADALRIVAPDVGGGFGPKNAVYPEYVLVLAAARRLGQPVTWQASRTEDFLTTAHGRDNRTHARLALDAAGTILGLEVVTHANLGAYLSPGGVGSCTNSPATAMGGVYAVPAVCMEVRGVFTNTTPIDAYRGAGKPEANYIIERLLDRAARETGIDAALLRRRNLIGAFPYRSALGMVIDCGDPRARLDAALAAADRDGFPARRAASAARGRLRGFGFACFLETARGAPGEWAAIRFAADGAIELASGVQSNGQGHETSFPQIAADRLGLPCEMFRIVQADTAQVPRGHGHGGARSLHMGGTALVGAMEAMLVRARLVAARLLQADAAALVYADGGFSVPGEARAIGLLALARAAAEVNETLDTEYDSPLERVTFPHGCHAAEVEIDPDTGAVALLRYVGVDDYGTLVNPMLTRGQVQGGLAQGIGQALMEEIRFDPDSGQMQSASLQDYCIPRAADLPGLEIAFAGIATDANPLGVKGAGQAGCIAAPQTVMNAVLDALAPLGIGDLDMPATPMRVWQAIARTRSGG